jgi:DNA polymerase
MLTQDAYRLYNEITACPLACKGISNNPQQGLIPRSYYFKRDIEAVSVLIVSKNPGQSPDHERDMYRACQSEHLSTLHLDFAEKVFNGLASVPSQYHTNLIQRVAAVLDVPATHDDVFSRATMTALVKCQSSGSPQAQLPHSTKSTCAEKHLFHEIALFKPVYLIALGSEVYDFLKTPAIRKRHGLLVGKVWHPSWSNMPGGWDHYRDTELIALREQYKTALADSRLLTQRISKQI